MDLKFGPISKIPLKMVNKEEKGIIKLRKKGRKANFGPQWKTPTNSN